MLVRITHVEFYWVGQDNQLGRYPIHFHMTGPMKGSLIQGCSVHHSFNRISTLHQVQYLKYYDNVGFESKGHALFVEDGVEFDNEIKRNLIFQTRPSYGLTAEDVHPANFWIKHPSNYFEGNVAGGSTHYGIWYSLNDHPEGPASTNSLCPIHEPLRSFDNNIAHSVGRYGLRIFPGHQPRQRPCAPYSDTNLPIDTTYSNFVAYRCQRNGAIAEFLGKVTFKNFYITDVIESGIEIGNIDQSDLVGAGYIKDSCVVGVGRENSIPTGSNWRYKTKGITTPKTERFIVENVCLHSFTVAGQNPWSTCSHCQFWGTDDQDGRTITFRKIRYQDVTTSSYVYWNVPKKSILFDEDGSLYPERGIAGSWITPKMIHNEVQDACSNAPEWSTGTFCDSSVTVRRSAWSQLTPANIRGQNMKIIWEKPGADEAYWNTVTNYQEIRY